MIELTFKGNSLEEVFGSMREALGGAKPKEVEVEAKEVSKATKNPVEKKGPVEKEEPVEEEVVEDSKPTLTMPEIRKMASAKAGEGKSKEIKEILAEMGIHKVTEIPEESFEEFVEKLEAL
ncbi:hypothetical protein [Streptococcus parauberis]|uniref:hypothetical protein n=1 Tax=Streptococcus parauberis TaxID=1348 RepID=UPI000E302DAD|nr:hypothetical protein [Streptococcus parauberis]RFE01111.1 hypothetical protein ADO06_01985 [Streptococcus parauberis]